MKRAITRLLATLARNTLRAYQPKVVAITGSVGKTSTRHAITTALGRTISVRSTEGNYNNELGLPLTILGEASPGRSVSGWMGVLWRGWKLSRGGQDYPKALVLEYGADARGDIAYLCQIAPPDIAVVTAVGVAHAQQLGTVEDVMEEKGTLVRSLTADGVAVLNQDDERVRSMAHLTSCPAVTYGLQTGDVHVKDVRLDIRHDGEIDPGEVVSRMDLVITSGTDQVHVTLTNVLGDAHVRSVVAAAAVALQLGLQASDVASNLSAYRPMPGRLHLIAGIKRTLLFDDTYNASPEAVHVALDTLSAVPVPSTSKRIAVLGDMLELGRYAERAHLDVGKHVASLPIDLLITVGEQARDIARGALTAGMDQSAVYTYAQAADAGRFLQSRMGRGDVVLLKGSQGVRVEKVTKEVMAQPLQAPELLVRQSAKWLAS